MYHGAFDAGKLIDIFKEKRASYCWYNEWSRVSFYRFKESLNQISEVVSPNVPSPKPIIIERESNNSFVALVRVQTENFSQRQ